MPKDIKISKRALCIRNVSNFSTIKPADKFPHRPADAERFNKRMPEVSPKLVELLNTIKRLDEADMKRHGKLFKHIVYSDIKNSSGGSKILAGALQSNGFTNAYDKGMKIDKEKLKENKNKNFALLSSLKVYDRDITVALKKSILTVFNDRTDNVHGEVIRIIVLDPGYKEGIDVFDVKYVHLFEPLVTPADETQVIGRGTRFCGQKGLTFKPNVGWPLHVFKYNLIFDDKMKEKYKAEDAHDLFLKNSGLNFEKLTFVSELERVTKIGAVDYDLTRNIHSNVFTQQTDLSVRTVESPRKKSFPKVSSVPGREKKKQYDDYFNNYSVGGLRKYKSDDAVPAIISTKKMGYDKMREHIKKKFLMFKWEKMAYENQCIEKKSDPTSKSNSKLIEFTPTQNFVTNYFHSETFNKGLLLWHSVGTGKTCSAISIATTGFEPKGYTILWVTRHTLKSDLWKNMFLNVCSADFRRKLINCDDYMPDEVPKSPLSYLSDRWLMPVSYKQFSNMLLGKNTMYKDMVRRNGKIDPLRKTLVVIDEVHKLFSKDVPAQERPNIEVINESIKRSYKLSGKDSVRLLLMTATPISSDPMDMIKILNMMREEDLPDTFEAFSQRYLNDQKKFSQKGENLYLDDIAGHISHLNRENDVRQFAYPVFHKVNAFMSKMKENTGTIDKNIKVVQERIDELSAIPLNGKPKEDKKMIRDEIKQLKEIMKELAKMKVAAKKTKATDENSQEVAIDRCIKKKD